MQILLNNKDILVLTAIMQKYNNDNRKYIENNK